MSFTGKGLHNHYRHEINSQRFPSNKIVVGEECDNPGRVGIATINRMGSTGISLDQEGIIRLIEALHQELILLREQE